MKVLIRPLPAVFAASAIAMAISVAAGCTPRPQVQSKAGAAIEQASVAPRAQVEPAEQAREPEGTPPSRFEVDPTPHAFTATDLLALDRLSDPQISADGQRIAYVLRMTDRANNRGRPAIWVVGADGSQPRVIAEEGPANHSPRWAPSGHQLFFLSRRSGSSQIWSVDVESGEVKQRSELPVDVTGFLLSPGGQEIAFTAEVFPGCDDLECTARRLADAAADPATGMAFDRLFVRHWDTWKDGRRSHLFVGGLGPAGRLQGIVDVTAGLDADVPSKPFGGTEEISFSPDGAHLLYTARVAGREEPWSTNFDLFKVPIGGGEAENLTADNPAWDTQPVFSPDGRQLAYLAMRRPGFEADRFRVMIREWPTGQVREVAPTWDRSPGSLLFSSDGSELYVTADHLGNHPLFAIDVASGAVREVVGDGYVSAVQRLGADALVFARDDLRSPADLFRVDPRAAGGEPTALTAVNRERLANLRMGAPEQFTFAGWRGEEVYGWVVRPPDLAPGARAPLAFLIHGGPQGSFGNHFHYRWNPQVYAGAGYAVAMIDFHGSTGYGQAFTDSISGDWGGKPLEDLKRGFAAIANQFPWIDSERACALGASYGGFMINWIAGQWPDGFRCLVNHDGVFDHRMMYFATEELWFAEWEQGGPYWSNVAGHERHNPAAHVAQWRTPMLIIHGSLDYRIPETQGLGAYTALQRRGIPSRLVVFPDENHWVLAPANSLQWHREVLGWLDRWLGPDAE